MKTELQEKLRQEFPNLYRNLWGDMRQTNMAWGIEVGEGWYKLIYDLSKKLEAEILKLPEEKRQYYCAAQIKEKFGRLRVYLEDYTNEMHRMIVEAEETSGTICEVCGAPGKTREHWGWLYTSCEEYEIK